MFDPWQARWDLKIDAARANLTSYGGVLQQPYGLDMRRMHHLLMTSVYQALAATCINAEDFNRSHHEPGAVATLCHHVMNTP